ncbi:MAG: S-layer homology domain-containing protein [Caldisericaceae bacterium]
MKKILLIFILFAVVVSTLPGNVKAQDVVANVSTDKSTYSQGDTVLITFSVKNNSSNQIKYTFNNSQIYDYTITKDGTTIYRWSKGRLFADVITYLTISPGETKIFKESWDMKDNSGKLVPDGTYVINFFLALPVSNTVSASKSFVVGAPSEAPIFKDVTDPTLNKYLAILVSKNLVKGYPDQTFRPDNNLTRTEGLVLIMRVLGITPSVYTSIPFKDVYKGFWGYDYIAEGVKRGIIKGVSATEFAPSATISRGEFTVMLVRAIKLDLTATHSPFVDVDSSYFGYKEIIAAYNAGLITGSKDSAVYYYPKDPITRGDAVIELGHAVEL